MIEQRANEIIEKNDIFKAENELKALEQTQNEPPQSFLLLSIYTYSILSLIKPLIIYLY